MKKSLLNLVIKSLVISMLLKYMLLIKRMHSSDCENDINEKGCGKEFACGSGNREA